MQFLGQVGGVRLRWFKTFMGVTFLTKNYFVYGIFFNYDTFICKAKHACRLEGCIIIDHHSLFKLIKVQNPTSGGENKKLKGDGPGGIN